MNILYDPQILTMQKYGGISRYFYEIITRLSSKEDVTVELPTLFSINYYFKEYYNPDSLLNSLNFKGKGILNRINFSRYLKRKNNDIIHPTYYNPYVFKRKSGLIVSTIHDLTQEMLPDFFTKDKKIIAQKKQIIQESDMIIAISQSTKNDILKYYSDVPENKIVVVHHGNFLKRRTLYNIPLDLKIPVNFILFTGTRRGYKNFNNFIYAIEPILTQNKDINLVCTGGGEFSEDETMLFQKMNIEKQVFHYNASDELLSYLYSKAICFIFPSLYEGFGLPILEAFDHQCPAVLSNTSSLPEIGDNAAIYFNPYNVGEMSVVINKVIEDAHLREQMIDLGNQRSKKFSWDKTAEDTYHVYKNMMG